MQKYIIKKSTDIIKKSIGRRPVSFRAGRYGINDMSLNLLKNEGYLIDTSVTPNVNWSMDGGPDWSKFSSTKPYFQDTLLEVPITIIKVMGIKYWLRPSISTASTMKTIVEILRSQQKGNIILNMMFHSMETIDPNPYIKSNLFFQRLRIILEFLYNKNIEFVTLYQLYNIMKSSVRGVSSRC